MHGSGDSELSVQGRNPKLINAMEVNTRKKASATAEAVSFAKGAAGAAPELVICVTCERSFKGAIGLGVHRRKAHPLDFHADHQVLPRVKARWAPEEMRRMAALESSLLLSGAKPNDINSLLVEKFPDRSREAIKGERRKDSYKQLVSNMVFVGPIVLPNPQTPESSMREDSIHQDKDLWRVDMLECTKDLLDKRGSPGEEPIWSSLQLAFDLLDCETVNLKSVKERLDHHAVLLTNLLSVKPPKRIRKRAPRKGHKFAGTDSEFVKSTEADGGPEKPTGKRTRKPNPRRIARTQAYARVQEAFRKNRKRCSEMVLEGKWEQEAATLGLEEQEAFWRPLFEEASKPDERPVPMVQENWCIVDPVSIEEVAKALHDSEESAPGPDGITLKEVRSISPSMLAVTYNLWLLAGYTPTRFVKGETILIPKGGDLKDPANYRPITMASRVTRIFHKILATRLTNSVPLDPRQKAFRPVDGCADNLFLLDTIIKDAQRRRRPLSIAFIDVAKAFDSVSHYTLARCLRRLGVPEPLVEYVRHMYDNTSTVLKVNGRKTAPIVCGRGVRQGDPLSAILFNCVIDEVIAGLSKSIGFELSENLAVRCLAFADDLVLVASSADGLRDLMTHVTEGLREGGLLINPAKCATLRIDIDGKAKRWIINPSSFLRLEGKEIKSLSIVETYKYLGLQAGPNGLRKAYGSFLREKLEMLTHAPLKPQQRMYILRCNLLPKTFHGLVLGETTAASLEQYDRMVRQFIRKWLRLPHDTPTAYFHAGAADGGLEIPRLRYAIPVMKNRRMLKLESSNDPVMQCVVNSPSFLAAKTRGARAAKVAGQVLDTGKDVKRLLATQLYTSVDGRGLRQQRQTPHVNNWVCNGSQLLNGGDYIQSVKVRGNLLQTQERSARGRRTVPTMCDAGCNAQGTLAHISQSCTRTHRLRCARHDSVLDYIIAKAEAKEHSVIREPVIPTRAGRRKPDLIAEVDGVILVVDVTIVADHCNLDRPFREKVDYYHTSDVTDWIAAIYPSRECEFGAVVFNWRGALDRNSSAILRRLGVSAMDETLLSCRVLTFTSCMFKAFTQSTVRAGRAVH